MVPIPLVSRFLISYKLVTLLLTCPSIYESTKGELRQQSRWVLYNGDPKEIEILNSYPLRRLDGYSCKNSPVSTRVEYRYAIGTFNPSDDQKSFR